MPRILYGTAWKAEATAQLVAQAFHAGFRGVDTAGQRKHYREDLVGQGIATARRRLNLGREQVWIQTKCAMSSKCHVSSTDVLHTAGSPPSMGKTPTASFRTTRLLRWPSKCGRRFCTACAT